MVNFKKDIMPVIIILIVMIFCVPYSYSQNKSSEEIPSEETMKKILLNKIIVNDEGLFKFTNAKFDIFQISNGFLSKDKNDGVSAIYNVQINYKISYERSFYKIISQPPGWKGHVGMKLPTLKTVDKYTQLGCKVSALKTEKKYKENNCIFKFIKKGNTWFDHNYWDYYL